MTESSLPQIEQLDRPIYLFILNEQSVNHDQYRDENLHNSLFPRFIFIDVHRFKIFHHTLSFTKLIVLKISNLLVTSTIILY